MSFLLQTTKDFDFIISEISVNDELRGLRTIFSSEKFEARATQTGTLVVFIDSAAFLDAEVTDRRLPEALDDAAAAAATGDADSFFQTAQFQDTGQWFKEPSRVICDVAALTKSLLSKEVSLLAENYRRMIREDLPSGKNLAVKTALNRVRVQEKFLSGLDMADQSEACELLRLSKSNPSATLKRIEDRGDLIRIERDGRRFYPLFQFDVENGRIHPLISEIMRLRPASWSNMRLCYWITRKHADFDRAPAELLGEADDEILDAFRRAIIPEMHG